MKSIREHRVQILAAIALAFSLGMVVPNMAFASEENADAGIETHATVTNASSKQLADLVAAIKNEPGYSKYEDLYEAQIALAENLENTPEAVLKAAQDAVIAITPNAQIGDLDAAALNDHILKNVQGYSDWSAMFTTMAQLEREVGANLSQSAISDKLSTQKITNYYNLLNQFMNRVQGNLSDNVAKLFVRVSTRDSFKGFRDSAKLVEATEKVATLKEDATEAEVKTAVDALRALLSGTEGVANMNATELVEAARATNKYAEYKGLYDAMGFINAELKKLNLGEGDDVEAKLAAGLAVTYADKQKELMDDYAGMAQAALKIDDSVMTGLMAYELPQTSAPDTPDTGIVGLIESGVLDLGTLTLIASLVVAGVLGISVIARLYTRKSMLRK